MDDSPEKANVAQAELKQGHKGENDLEQRRIR